MLSSCLLAHPSRADGPQSAQGNAVDNLPRESFTLAPSSTVTLEKSDANSALETSETQFVTPVRFNINGVRVLPFELVANEFSPLANKSLHVSDLVAAADRVTRIYREYGYVLSFAYVPAQKFENNIVEVNVVEGYVEKISFTGNPGALQDRLESIAAKLRTVRPLTDQAFQRVAGLLQLEPSVQISASIAPPLNTDGAAEMTVNVKKSLLTTSLSMDNTTSRLRGLISVTGNALTPLGEQITVSTLEPPGKDRERYYALNYAQPIGTNGLMLQFSAYDYSAKPNNNLLLTQGLESGYESRTSRAAVTLGYPFILDSHRNLTGTAGLYAVENTSTFRYLNDANADIRLESQTRALSLEYSWQLTSDSSVLQASGGLYQGLGILGAGAADNRSNVRFNRVRGQFMRADSYPGNWGTVVSGIAQYSGDVLPPSEQISFGGRLFGMGYPANDSTGDSGWGLAIEGNRSFTVDTRFLKRVQAYVATDQSRTSLNASSLPRGKLSSVGFGVRLSDLQYYSLDLSIAKPTGDRAVNDQDRSLRYNLLFNYKTQ